MSSGRKFGVDDGGWKQSVKEAISGRLKLGRSDRNWMFLPFLCIQIMVFILDSAVALSHPFAGTSHQRTAIRNAFFDVPKSC